jgi:hypothetical protein
VTSVLGFHDDVRLPKRRTYAIKLPGQFLALEAVSFPVAPAEDREVIKRRFDAK